MKRISIFLVFLSTCFSFEVSSQLVQPNCNHIVNPACIIVRQAFGQMMFPPINPMQTRQRLDLVEESLRDRDSRGDNRSRSRAPALDNSTVTSVVALANESMDIVEEVGEAPTVCLACFEEAQEEEEDGNDVPEVVVDEADENRFPALTRSFSADGANCSSFINSSGSYGTHGNTIVASLRARGEDSPFYSDDLYATSEWCPNWRNLSNEEKEHFWVWTFAAIAHDESTCRDRAIGDGVNSTALGLLQLEDGARLNWNRRRPPNYLHENCTGRTSSIAADLRNPANNLRCGMDILEYQISHSDRPLFNGTFRSQMYWQELRQEDGGVIGEMIREYPSCRLTP